jgi:hypothetical protein
MIAQSYTLIRCLLEPLFPLVAISKDPQFINLLIDSDEIKRKKNIERNIKYLERNKIQGNIEELKKLMVDLKEKIKRENLKEIKVYDCAVKADLEDIYNIYYSFTSMHLHVGMKSLEEGMVLDLDNLSIEELKNEPELNGL